MFEQLARFTIADIATRLGFKQTRGGFGPCPTCGAAKRGSSDRRPPITCGRQSWRCWACGARGDGVALLAAALVGGQPSRGDRDAWRRLWDKTDALLGGMSTRRPPRAKFQPIEEPKPPRPPAQSIETMWRTADGPTQDGAVFKWCKSRALDPCAVGRLGLGRALPFDTKLPNWARCGGRSWRAGWRLILPAWGATGQMESIRARWVMPSKAPAKEVSARAGSGSARRLVYCNEPAFLKAGRAGIARRIVIVEGGPDYLTLSTTCPEWVVFGVWSGSWGDEFAARIPDRSEVVIWTDSDAAGREYAQKIFKSLELRNITIKVKQ